MNPTHIAVLLGLALICVTVVTLYAVLEASHRVEIRDRQDRATQRAWITAMGALETVIANQQAHIERIIGVNEQPTNQVDPEETMAAYEAAMNQLNDLHTGVSEDAPDWSDAFIPREATHRVATIRPGQSPIPGAPDSVVDGDAQPNYGAEEEYVWGDE